MTTCMLARAFVNLDGAHGNPALVIVEPEGVTTTSQRRQDLADDLAIPATVFVQDAVEGRVSIHSNYGLPIRFGGHPSLAAVEVLHRLGFPVTSIVPEAGRVSCRRDSDDTVWLTAPAGWSKPWRHYQMDSPEQIDALIELPDGEDFTQVWAWIDEPAGRIRARTPWDDVDSGAVIAEVILRSLWADTRSCYCTPSATVGSSISTTLLPRPAVVPEPKDTV